MTIAFKRATLADAVALLEVQIRAFHDDTRLYGVELGGPPGYDSLDSMQDDLTHHDCYKITSDGQIVGGITLWDEGEGHVHLDRLYIDPNFHNRGIGSQAMHFMEATYPTATQWSLHTPQYAVRNQHFYEKFGYRNVGEVIEEGGIILIAYQKP